MNKPNEGDKDLLSDVAEVASAGAASAKLHRGPLEVSVNDFQDQLDVLELDELTLKTNLEQVDRTTEDGKRIAADAESALKKLAEQRVELEARSVKAYLMPMLYRDYRLVQTAVAEAILSVEGMGFDTNARIVMVLQERKLMTVYLTLRKFTNYEQRYYNSLDEIARVSDRTIDKIYEAYVKHFEVTPDERKKS